jgi:predicted GNAT superfamily acetyltransferase
MNAALKLNKIAENTNATLKNALTQTFTAFVKEIYAVMDDLGEDKEEYLVRVYPWAIERLDGQPVPEKLLRAIQQKLQSDQ